uniref:Cytochrome c oxidase subunit 3 n=1 Tax=Wellcomia compar TaxID=2744580 RepID=A0A8F7CHV5_9BILA|nr:cytochrome c oxidase subunit 3 [Wellcomia compar]
MFFNAHVVGSCIYPFFLSCSLLSIFLSFVVFFKSGLFVFFLYSFFFFLFVIFLWSKDVYFESAIGCHNFFVKSGFKMGFVVFVCTEIMFFFCIFWVYLDKVFFYGFSFMNFPFEMLGGLGLSLLGTFVLIISSFMVTWAHSRAIAGKCFFFQLLFSFLLGCCFLFIQCYEYCHLFFNISDGWLGSIFFFLTGFHGLHVFLGVVLLFLNLMRLLFFFFVNVNNFFFEGSVIYWHFVDVIWLMLFLLVYV